MRQLIVLFLMAVLAASAGAAPKDWRQIGDFSNLTWSDSEDPHTKSGWAIRLYRSGSDTYGDITIANGSIEPARARLHDIVFDPATGTITFKAKHSPDDTGRKAETLEFSGKVEPKALVGIMYATDYDSDDYQKKKKRVRIPREPGPILWRNYAEWDKNTPPLIK